MAKTRVPGWVALRCLIAASWYEGSDAGWVKPLAMKSPAKIEGLFATTSPATRRAVTSPTTWTRDHRADSPLPSNMKRAKRTSGVARSVERSARPAVVSVMNDFSTLPTAVGLENGKGPTERISPTKSSTRKKARSRQRTKAADTRARTGTAYDVASNQISWV